MSVGTGGKNLQLEKLELESGSFNQQMLFGLKLKITVLPRNMCRVCSPIINRCSPARHLISCAGNEMVGLAHLDHIDDDLHVIFCMRRGCHILPRAGSQEQTRVDEIFSSTHDLMCLTVLQVTTDTSV